MNIWFGLGTAAQMQGKLQSVIGSTFSSRHPFLPLEHHLAPISPLKVILMNIWFVLGTAAQ